MTEQQIAEALALAREVRERAEAATPGPWSEDGIYAILRYVGKFSGPWDDIDDDAILPDRGDAPFIALARTAGPALADAVVALVAELATAKAEIARLREPDLLTQIDRAMGYGDDDPATCTAPTPAPRPGR